MHRTESADQRDVQPLRTPWLPILVLVLVAIGAWIFIARLHSNKPHPVPPGISVAAAVAKSGDLELTLDALGTVTPVYTVTVTSRVAGELKEIHYREGQTVKKNDLLAVIDPSPYQAAVLQAQGQLARDQAILKNAQVDLDRYQEAFRQHAVPEQQVATQQATVEQDEGTINIDQGNLNAANVNLAYTRIVSPIDGRVGLRGVDPGNIVAANGTAGLVTITQLQPITVIFDVAEDDLSYFSGWTGEGAPMRVDAFDRAQERVLATGTLITIDNQINTASGTVRGRAQFANAHNELFPNQFVNARLHVKTLQGAILVPTAVIQRNGDNAYVYVVQDGKAQNRAIKIVATEGETSAVTGVKVGETLVADGFDKLQDGAKVSVRAPSPPPAGPEAGKSGQ